MMKKSPKKSSEVETISKLYTVIQNQSKRIDILQKTIQEQTKIFSKFKDQINQCQKEIEVLKSTNNSVYSCEKNILMPALIGNCNSNTLQIPNGNNLTTGVLRRRSRSRSPSSKRRKSTEQKSTENLNNTNNTDLKNVYRKRIRQYRPSNATCPFSFKYIFTNATKSQTQDIQENYPSTIAN